MAYCVVLISAPGMEEGRRLARTLVEARLAACVNVVPGAESLYWWQGKVEQAQEALLVAKTAKTRVKELVKAVKREHQYQVPEVVALAVKGGNRDYLNWIDESVGGPKAPKQKGERA